MFTQNCSIAEVGKALQSNSSKQGQLKQVAVDCWVLSISKDGVSVAFLGNLCQLLTTPFSKSGCDQLLCTELSPTDPTFILKYIYLLGIENVTLHFMLRHLIPFVFTVA